MPGSAINHEFLSQLEEYANQMRQADFQQVKFPNFLDKLMAMGLTDFISSHPNTIVSFMVNNQTDSFQEIVFLTIPEVSQYGPLTLLSLDNSDETIITFSNNPRQTAFFAILSNMGTALLSAMQKLEDGEIEVKTRPNTQKGPLVDSDDEWITLPG